MNKWTEVLNGNYWEFQLSFSFCRCCCGCFFFKPTSCYTPHPGLLKYAPPPSKPHIIKVPKNNNNNKLHCFRGPDPQGHRSGENSTFLGRFDHKPCQQRKTKWSGDGKVVSPTSRAYMERVCVQSNSKQSNTRESLGRYDSTCLSTIPVLKPARRSPRSGRAGAGLRSLGPQRGEREEKAAMGRASREASHLHLHPNSFQVAVRFLENQSPSAALPRFLLPVPPRPPLTRSCTLLRSQGGTCQNAHARLPSPRPAPFLQ